MLYFLLALLIFIFVLVIRALRCVPKNQPQAIAEKEPVDREAAVSHLQELIRARTVSYRDQSLEDEKEFEKLEALLPRFYPHVYAACEFHKPSPRSLLFHWKGKSAEKPGVLMAH